MTVLPFEHQASNRRQAQVDAFAQRHFTWPGTLHLHRAAIGLDILRAPINLLLSPILVLARVTAWICRRLHLPRIANWLLDRRLLLRTAVSARVEAATLNDLLDVPLPAGNAIADRAAMARTVLAAPKFSEMMRSRAEWPKRRQLPTGSLARSATIPAPGHRSRNSPPA